MLWKTLQQQAMTDPKLIAYYDFQIDIQNVRLLKYRSYIGSELDGAIVGAKRTNGPWPGKDAIDFKRPSDRIRLYLPGSYTSITLAAWMKIDGLDRSHISFMLTVGFDIG